ncbi:MAG: ChaN family lipoprotein, partial [Burkholderiales bacterium]
MASTSSCLAPATWYAFTNGTLQKTSESEVLARASRRDVVLLGEHHDDPDHHLWQLQVLAALHMLRPEMVIGFEAFPRRVQAVLDQWTAGQLTPSQFLERVEWQKIWSVPAALYLPLFEFARLNRIPMAALNVDRTLTAEISRNGWNAVPEERREGVSRAAPALRAYEDSLFEAFTQHSKVDDKRAASRDDPAFRRFVEAQTTWDRAMAEAIASRLGASGISRPLVVGIMGSGHVQHGHGVAHQLHDLG